MLTAMAALHPYEYVSFNALVDTNTPGALTERYDNGLLADVGAAIIGIPARALPRRRPARPMRNIDRQILFQNDKDRAPRLKNLYVAHFYRTARGFHLPAANPQEAGFYQLIPPLINPRRIPDLPPFHSVHAYGSAISPIYGKDGHAYRAAYDDVAANGDPLAQREL